VYQSVNTRTRTLNFPGHSGNNTPITVYVPISVPRAGSILRIAMETDVAIPISIDFLEGANTVDPVVFPLADDAYFIMSADISDGVHYSQYGLNDNIYSLGNNMSSQLSNTIYARMTFNSASPVGADVINLKTDIAVAISS